MKGNQNEKGLSTKEKIYIVGGVAFVFAIALLLQSGWRPSGHFAVNGGSLEITIPETGSKLYVDNSEEYETKKDNETYTVKRMSVKQHLVAISKKGSWPWLKNVEIKKDKTVRLRAFTLPQTGNAKDISNTDSKYSDYQNRFWKHGVADEYNKLISPNKNFAVWLDKNIIFAQWLGDEGEEPTFFCKNGVCASRIEVLNSTLNITDVAFYKDYDDVLIFSNEDGIYGIDLNKDGTQNFQPFAPLPNSLLIADKDFLLVKTGQSIKEFTL